MNNNLTRIIYILDRSGSMAGLELDTIGGFNSLIEKQKKEAGDAYLTTILFDDKYEVLHDRVDMKKVRPISENEYYARGCTALLDAIGRTINNIIKEEDSLIEAHCANKVIFIITTDGMENASMEYGYKDIKRLIEKQKEKEGWEFVFLGANIDALEEAERFGIKRENATNYVADEVGTEMNFKVMSKAISYFRSKNELSEDWKKDIEADFLSRGND